MLTTLFGRARRGLAAYIAYRRTVAEIEAMSQHELIDLGVYPDDLRAEAWKRLRDR